MVEGGCMWVIFYGVRGFILIFGVVYIKYGGNIVCVYVEFNDGIDIILDLGMGICLLGNKLKNKIFFIYLLLSYNYWDYI